MVTAVDELAQPRAKGPAPDLGLEPGLDLLVSTIEELSESRTIEAVAAVVRSAARRISGADGVCFVLRDGEECHYLDEDAVGPLWKGQRFPVEACISGWSMLNGETAVVRDVFEDNRIPHAAYAPTFVKSLVMTPVRPADPLAAIGAYWGEVREPSAEEVVKLQMVARATATALEKVRLISSLEDALERRDFLIRELDHRVKNNLASVRSIVQQTLGSAVSGDGFKQDLRGRLDSLLGAYELISRQRTGEALLGEVARQALAAHEGPRLTLDGPPVRLTPQTAVNLQLAFHELAVNAVRHGALSAPEGRVAVAWRIDTGAEPHRLVLTWQERGGPAVEPPRRKGFGLRLVETALARGLGGQAGAAFEPDGLRYELSAPLSAAIRAD